MKRSAGVLVLSSVIGACNGTAPSAVDGGGKPDPGGKLDPGMPVNLGVPAPRAAALAALEVDLDKDAPATAAAFATRWRPTYSAQLGYDPLAAQGFDQLQAAQLKLNEGEVAMLGQRGFVVSARQSFPSFFYGYKSIYADDLPVFISADSILHAVHRSYDAILKEVEQLQIITSLGGLLEGMHRALASGAGQKFGAAIRADADLYLTVARRLLQVGVRVDTVAGATAAQVDEIVSAAMAANGTASLALFGDPKREVDFSQFKPRGHYAGEPRMEAYFRAMIWLGRMDLRLISEQRFVRRQFEVSLLLSLLLDQGRRSAWQDIDGALRSFVGESDNMTVLDMDRLATALGVPIAELADRTDQQLAQAINEGDFGIQRIASQILFVPPLGLNAPLDRAWLLFGQRYVLDSEVLSNVVFDRVLAVNEKDRRMLPDPLDVAFAALANTHAAPLLATDLQAHQKYPTALHRARLLAERHESAFWEGSLYHAWLGALRAMSPPADLAGPDGQALPAVARTEAWSRRVLNSQLASWAELRHDTLLYAKQSYTGYPVCEFPDAYVDPYPALWAALARYAERGAMLVEKLPNVARGRASQHFAELRAVAQRLEDMANRQRTGTPFTAEQIGWVNQVVNIKEVPNCSGPIQVPDGWYVRLFYNPADVTKMDPTIADVHTNPFDTEVLHAATGLPRLLVMTAETCTGPRAYVGLASAYHEKLTTNFRRLTDAEWLEEVKTSPPDVRWMKDLVAR
jgi:hypothetical protein